MVKASFKMLSVMVKVMYPLDYTLLVEIAKTALELSKERGDSLEIHIPSNLNQWHDALLGISSRILRNQWV